MITVFNWEQQETSLNKGLLSGWCHREKCCWFISPQRALRLRDTCICGQERKIQWAACSFCLHQVPTDIYAKEYHVHHGFSCKKCNRLTSSKNVIYTEESKGYELDPISNEYWHEMARKIRVPSKQMFRDWLKKYMRFQNLAKLREAQEKEIKVSVASINELDVGEFLSAATLLLLANLHDETLIEKIKQCVDDQLCDEIFGGKTGIGSNDWNDDDFIELDLEEKLVQPKVRPEIQYLSDLLSKSEALQGLLCVGRNRCLPRVFFCVVCIYLDLSEDCVRVMHKYNLFV
jgi:hypothetical protein